jgi:molybdate transport system substrate-binding protein
MLKLLPSLGFLIALFPLAASADEVVVFAASSLKGPLDAIATAFQAETGHQVVISYGGSNALANQIIEGAPADIFLSAAPNWMDKVQEAGLLDPGSRQDLVGNDLVLVAHGSGAAPVDLAPGLDLVGLLGDGKLSMADVQSVPAGQYGKASLEHFGMWEAVQPHVIQSENVRSALGFVALGEAPLGIVYSSDALAEPGVSVVARFPDASHPSILYPAALIADVDAVDRAFFQLLSGDAADAIFASAGFHVLN